MAEKNEGLGPGVPAAAVHEMLDSMERLDALALEGRASRRRFRIGMAWRLALMAAVVYLGFTGDLQRVVLDLLR